MQICAFTFIGHLVAAVGFGLAYASGPPAEGLPLDNMLLALTLNVMETIGWCVTQGASRCRLPPSPSRPLPPPPTTTFLQVTSCIFLSPLTPPSLPAPQTPPLPSLIAPPPIVVSHATPPSFSACGLL